MEATDIKITKENWEKLCGLSNGINGLREVLLDIASDNIDLEESIIDKGLDEAIVYELTIIAEVNNEDKQGTDSLIKRYAEIQKFEDEDVKRLAYSIMGMDYGHYYYYEIKLNKKNAPELCSKLNIKDSVLRYLLVPQDTRKK